MAFDRGDGSTGTGAASVLPITGGGTGADTALEAFSNLTEGNVVVDSAGNVGIGTATPARKLDIAGSTPDSSSIRAKYTGSASNGNCYIVAANNNNDEFYFLQRAREFGGGFAGLYNYTEGSSRRMVIGSDSPDGYNEIEIASVPGSF
jgi:hypothetical protein